jgi:hypothetical protein
MTLERKIQLIELGEDQLGMGRNQLARSIEGRGGRISRLGFGGEEDKREERRSWWESRSTNGKSSEPNTRLAGKVQRKQGRQARLTLRQHKLRPYCLSTVAVEAHLHRGPPPQLHAWNWQLQSFRMWIQDPSCMWQAQCARNVPSCSTWDACDRATQSLKTTILRSFVLLLVERPWSSGRIH